MKTQRARSAPPQAPADLPSRTKRQRRWRRGRWWLVITFLFGFGSLGSFYGVHLVSPGSTIPRQTQIAQPPHGGFYMRNQMWLADARTLANMVSYLLTPEMPPNTNHVVKG